MRKYARVYRVYVYTRAHVHSSPPISLAVLHIPPHPPHPRGTPYTPLLFTIFTRRSFIKSGRPRAFSILSMLQSTYRRVPLSLRSRLADPDSRARNALSSRAITGLPKFFPVKPFGISIIVIRLIFCRSYTTTGYISYAGSFANLHSLPRSGFAFMILRLLRQPRFTTVLSLVARFLRFDGRKEEE